MKNRGSAGDDGKGEAETKKIGGARGTTGKAKRLSFSLPSVPRALSFRFSPGSARLLFTSPQFPARSPYEKIRGLCGGERDILNFKLINCPGSHPAVISLSDF